jgi:nitrate/nitrite transport system substrate-binding protein
MWLSYWLASCGIDPLRDVRIITVPPPQMVARLGDGSIDGCCVGEPWGAQAVATGVGVTVATSQQIWPGHPEKVLASSARFVDEQPAAAAGLVRALLEACRLLDEPKRRSEAAALLAVPAVVGAALPILQPRFVGDYDDGMGHTWHDPQAVRFFADGQVTWPAPADAIWFLTQFRRWGLLAQAPDYSAIAADLQCAGIYRSAASALGIAVPEGRSAVTLCDGRVWDGRDPEAYALSFPIRA